MRHLVSWHGNDLVKLLMVCGMNGLKSPHNQRKLSTDEKVSCRWETAGINTYSVTVSQDQRTRVTDAERAG